MVQLAQMTRYVERTYACEDLLLVARQRDKLFVYFSHLVDSLCFFGKQYELDFSRFLPASPEQVLAQELPPAYAFQILRCELQPIFAMTPEMREQKIELFKLVVDTWLSRKKEAAITCEDAVGNKYWDETVFIEGKRQDIWKSLSPELYFIFWQTSLQSLVVPKAQYDDEINRLKEAIEKLKREEPRSKEGKFTKEIKKLMAQKQFLMNELKE